MPTRGSPTADATYRDKYARYPSYVQPMVSDQARGTTLRLVPADDEDRAWP